MRKYFALALVVVLPLLVITILLTQLSAFAGAPSGAAAPLSGEAKAVESALPAAAQSKPPAPASLDARQELLPDQAEQARLAERDHLANLRSQEAVQAAMRAQAVEPNGAQPAVPDTSAPPSRPATFLPPPEQAAVSPRQMYADWNAPAKNPSTPPSHTAPFAPTSQVFTTTLQNLHRNTRAFANSSSYQLTNLGSADAMVLLEYYWPGQLTPAGSESLTIPPSGASVVNMSFSPLPDPFFGRLLVSSDQPLQAQTQTPDYGVLSGKVYLPDGVTPVEGAWLQVDWPAGPNWNMGDVMTLPDGSYYLGGLPAASYNLALNPGGLPYARAWWQNQTDPWLADPIALASGQQRGGFDFILQPAGFITGTVYAADGVTPLSYANVDIDHGNFGACTDANGYYEIHNVGYGSHKVYAGSSWNWCLGQPSIYVLEYYSGVADSSLATLVDINAGQTSVGNINFTLDVGGVIRGLVTDSQTGLPIANVHIMADGVAPMTTGSDAWTAADGSYEIRGLSSGSYRVKADDWGNLPEGYRIEYYNNTIYWDQYTPVAVVLGAASEGINFALEPGGKISGMLTAAAGGAPLSNMNVNVKTSDGLWGMGACSQADGSWMMKGIPFGSYTISVNGQCGQNNSSIYAGMFYNGKFSWQTADVVQVSNTTPVTGIDFALPVGASITGRVTAQASGLPIQNARVWINEYNTGDFYQEARTNASGVYTFTGLIEGVDYRLQVDADWQINPGFSMQYYNGHWLYADADHVFVTFGSHLTGYDFALEPGGTASGYVYDQQTGLPLANINVDLQSDRFGLGSCTDQSGRFWIQGIPHGQPVKLRAGGDWNYCQNQPNTYAQEYYSETTINNQAVVWTLGPGLSDLTGIKFTLELGAQIKGRVTDAANNTPLANVWVFAEGFDTRYSYSGGMTDANGEYTIGGLPSGDYRVKVDNPDWLPAAYAVQYYSQKVHDNLADRVTLAAGQVLAGIDFPLQPGGVVRGRVVDQLTGLPIANEAVGINNPDISNGYGTCTDANGYFVRPNLPYGRYEAMAGGEWNWCKQSSSDYIREYYSETTDWNMRTLLTVDAGSPAFDQINFTLLLGGKISGRVFDAASGLPLAGANVSFAPADQPWWRWGGSNSAADGSYTIGGVPSGDYIVAVNEAWGTPAGYAWQYYPNQVFMENAGILHITTGQEITGIDFGLAPGGVITGAVYDQVSGLPLANISVGIGMWNKNGGSGQCTDSQGRFEAKGVPFGVGVTLQAANNPWENCQNAPSQYAREIFRDKVFWSEADIITLDAGSPTLAGADFTLERGASVRGQVKDEQNKPVANMWVEAKTSQPGCSGCEEWLGGTSTDANGFYQIDGLPNITLTVQAIAEKSSPPLPLVSEFYGGGYEITSAAFFHTVPAGIVSGIDLQVGPGIVLDGDVTVPPGYSPAGLQVDTWTTWGKGFWSGGVTDASGHYEIHIPPMQDTRWAVAVRPWGTDLGSQWAHDFSLTQDGTHWDFDLSLGGTLQGCISDAGWPVSQANVWADSMWISQGMNGQTAADGCYSITNLPPGDYSLNAEAWPQRLRLMYGGFDWGWNTQIHLAAGQTVSGLNFDLPLTGQIKGRITDAASGQPLEKVWVIAMTDRGFWQAWSQTDGTYSIDAPAGADYRLLFAPFDLGIYDSTFYTTSLKLEHTFQGAGRFPVPPLKDGFVQMNAALVRLGDIHGVVRDAASHTPLGGIYVAAELANSTINTSPTGYGGCTDDTGAFTIANLGQGTWRLRAAGLCGNDRYQDASLDVSLPASGSLAQDILMTARSGPAPARPFTVRIPGFPDYDSIQWTNYVQGTGWNNVRPALFSPLAELDDNGNWRPALLASVPTLANGGAAMINGQLVVTFTLKAGLSWSDGQPLTSADLRYTWQKYTAVRPFFDSYLAQIGPAFMIESMTTPDALTAVATFRKGEAPPEYLSAVLYPLPEHIWAATDRLSGIAFSEFMRNPVGSGPYVVESWIPGGELRLRANANYYRRAEGLPLTSEMRFVFTGPFDESIAWGVADVVSDIGQEIYENPAAYGARIYEAAVQGFDSLRMSPRDPLLADVSVRKALNYALNRPALYNSKYQMGYPAWSYVPVDHPEYANTYTVYNYDPAQARSLLAAAGWVDQNSDGVREKNGQPLVLTLHVNQNSPFRIWQAAQVQTMFADVGIQLIVVQVQPDNWGMQIRQQFDLFIGAWWFDGIVDAQAGFLWDTASIATPRNNWNGMFGSFSDPAQDALVSAIKTTPDLDTLRTLYAQQIQTWSANAYAIPLSNTTRKYAAQPTLQNFKPGTTMPFTWNLYEWFMPANPYDIGVRQALAVNSPAARPGATLIYELNVANSGFFSVTQAVLGDELPAGASLVSADPPPSRSSNGIWYWDLGSLPAGQHLGTVRLGVHVPLTATHGSSLVNRVFVYAAQTDSTPGNNAAVLTLQVRDDVDLALHKNGVGFPTVGEKYDYYLEYRNLGGAPASQVVLTDVLPPQVSLLSASPAPSQVNGQTLTWNLADVPGNQYGGRIKVTVTIHGAGSASNLASIRAAETDVNPGNNSVSFTLNVNSIRAPIILRPLHGVTDQTPIVSGLAPVGSVVGIWDYSAPLQAMQGNRLNGPLSGPTLLMTTTATDDGTFSAQLNLAPDAYFIAARASKSGLTSADSDLAYIVVAADLALDPDSVTIQSAGVDITAGVVRAQRRTLANRQLDVQAALACASQPTAHLQVTENGLFHYTIPHETLADLGDGKWQLNFRFWMAEVHSTYDIWIDWDCGGAHKSELLLYILIDPDGFVYDQSLVDGGSQINSALLTTSVITAYVSTVDGWEIWPASLYGQTNPQSSDPAVADGVTQPGYYSFLTPPGQYRIEAWAPGYEPYMSEIMTVITAPIHLDIGLRPIVGGELLAATPADLAASSKIVNRGYAWLGDTLTYTVTLQNSGDLDSSMITTDENLPAELEFVSASAGVTYDTGTRHLTWHGVVPGRGAAAFTYRVRVASVSGTPFTLKTQTFIYGSDFDLRTLPATPFETLTDILNRAGVALAHNESQSAIPGALGYAHVLTNSGNYTDTFQIDAVSSQGWAVDAPQPLTVGAGKTAPVYVTLHIPDGTLMGTQDTLRITATSQTASLFSASLQDQTTVSRVIGVSLSPASGQSNVPATTLTYQHTLHNTGNAPDTFSFQASSSRGWTVDVPTDRLLAAGGQATVNIVVHIPAGAAAGLQDTTTVTARSAANPAILSQSQDVTTVNQVAAVDLQGAGSTTQPPSAVLIYQHTIHNTGNGTDTFSFTASSNRGWTVDKPANVTLASGAQTNVQVTVHIPAGAAAGLVDTTTLTAISQFNTAITAQAQDVSTVAQVAALTLSTAAGQESKQGVWVTFVHTIRNTGNGSDTFTFSALSSRGWMVSLPANVTLAAGEQIDVILKVFVPANASTKMVDTTTFTARSMFNNAVTASAQDVTTVKAQHNLFLPKVNK